MYKQHTEYDPSVARARCGLPTPSRSLAAVSSTPFQSATWFGCASYCRAGSSGVFSPSVAASAILGLKAGA